MVLKYLKPNMTFLDVGAHVGYFTVLGSWLVGSDGQVHSFEPTPSTFHVLRLNAEHIQNVRLNPIAIGSGAVTATFNDYGPAFSGYNSMYRAREDWQDMKQSRN
jgi:FkbM family methyltransferase